MSFYRSEEILIHIIKTHVETGNYIVNDGWNDYSWITREVAWYIHSVHIHGHGDFGHG